MDVSGTIIGLVGVQLFLRPTRASGERNSARIARVMLDRYAPFDAKDFA
jgi:hypothetical protein